MESKKVLGKIHSIESFGTVDGPGIRFVVFFQGCPMQCRYCHNPDTQPFSNAELELDPQQLLSRMTRNMPFYKSGGITATGGEPLCQREFLLELFTEAKRLGIHTCLDTSGITFNENDEYFDKLIAVTDLVMLDIKHIDEEEHVKLTSLSGGAPLRFAKYLHLSGAKFRIRHVLIPSITDAEEYLVRLGKFLKEISPIEELEILPYHLLGKAKYDNLGIPYPLEGIRQATEEDVRRAKKIIGAAML